MPSAKVDVGGETPANLNDLMLKLFWKETLMAEKAAEFLNYIKEWGRTETPYRVNQWENYCLRHNMTQSKYHNMLKRLRRAGLVTKKYNKTKRVHELFLSDAFSKHLDEMSKIWNTYTRA